MLTKESRLLSLFLTGLLGSHLMVYGAHAATEEVSSQSTAKKQVVSAEKTFAKQTQTEQSSHYSNNAQLFSSLNEQPVYRNPLMEIYAAHHQRLLWQDQKAITEFEQQLAQVALSGVQPQFNQWVILLANPEIKGMQRDVILSDALLGYLQFASGVNSKGDEWLYNSKPYKLSPPSSRAISQFQQAVNEGHLFSFVQSLAPQHPQYIPMSHALNTLLKDSQPWPKLTSTKTLRPGETSADIAALRTILQRTDMLSAHEVAEANIPIDTRRNGIEDDLSVDEEHKNAVSPQNVTPSSPPSITSGSDVYNDSLVNAVKRFQKWQGLTEDGVIGARTREWLNASPQQRAALLALNIQRLRILPGHIDTGIMVNIPNYSLVYYQKGNEILASRVIVGRPSRKTPLMSSSLNNVVVNPPWNVPTKLVREDIVPKAIHDIGYFKRHGYTLLSDWSGSAQEIDPTMIDWNTISAKNFPYRIRQAPGESNSLGRFKFNMPSSEAIYLHDTPNHNLFQKDVRALSSGCVRVNKASDLAGLLLRDTGWNNSRITTTLDQGQTTYVPIRQRIPVRLYYLTAWVGENGVPQFRTDIYNYDDTVHSGMTILPSARHLLQQQL